MYSRADHLEVPVLDTEKAKEFFSIFGWKDHYMDFEPGRYTLVNGEGENPVSFGCVGSSPTGGTNFSFFGS